MLGVLLFIVASGVFAVGAIGQTLHPEALSAGEEKMNTRGIVDTVGYARTESQILEVVKTCERLESDSLSRESKRYPAPWVAVISPHDDYLYAGRVYVHALRNVRAKTLVLFGVAHRAKDWGFKDKLILDSYESWSGPFGPVRISSIRETLIAGLDPADYIVSDNFQSKEHSLEGLIPFLQYYNRDIEIVPILVPYMHWERMECLAGKLAQILVRIIAERGWVLGEDIAFVISSDSIHYGDEDWGGKNYAPFGSDQEGYEKAVARESELVREHLSGPVSGERLRSFLYRLVDENDLTEYKITWCGRFSIPFGLDCANEVTMRLRKTPLEGHFLRYATSLDPGKPPPGIDGLGITAPATLHHWVGYCAIGYR